MAKKADGLTLRKGKTKDTWWLDFIFEGKRHRVRIGSRISRTVAREIASVKRAAILKGEAGIGGKKKKALLFDTAVEEFLTWAKASKRPGTVEFYGYCFQALGESFKGRMLSEIHPFLIEKHKQLRLAAGHRVAVNRELGALKALFNRCLEWKKFEGANPVKTVQKVDEPLNKLRFLSEAEEAALVAASAAHLVPVLMVGIHAGLRINAEALTLKWENVDLDRRLITIEAVYSKNRETQTIPINSTLLTVFQRLWETRRGDYVFSKPDGQPHRSIRTAFTKACQRARLSAVTPHTLRHTYASRLAMKGVNDVTLQTLGQWKEPKMIRRYAHLSQQHLAEAVELIAFPVTGVTTRKAAVS